jgi:hypothetical protein
MATGEQIRRAMHQQPFRPFMLRLADGRTYRIGHPDFIAIPPGDRPREVTFYDQAGGPEK